MKLKQFCQTCPRCGDKFAEFIRFENADLNTAAAVFSCLLCSPDCDFRIVYVAIGVKEIKRPAAQAAALKRQDAAAR